MKTNEMTSMLAELARLATELARARLAENNFMVQRDDNGREMIELKKVIENGQTQQKSLRAQIDRHIAMINGIFDDMKELHAFMNRPSEAKLRLENILAKHGLI